MKFMAVPIVAFSYFIFILNLWSYFWYSHDSIHFYGGIIHASLFAKRSDFYTFFLMHSILFYFVLKDKKWSVFIKKYMSVKSFPLQNELSQIQITTLN